MTFKDIAPQQEDKTCTVCGEPITKDMRAMPSGGGSFTGATHWKHFPPCRPTEPAKDENTTFNGYGNTSGGTATMLPTGKPQQECSEVCGAECTNMLHHPPSKALEEGIYTIKNIMENQKCMHTKIRRLLKAVKELEKKLNL